MVPRLVSDKELMSAIGLNSLRSMARLSSVHSSAACHHSVRRGRPDDDQRDHLRRDRRRALSHALAAESGIDRTSMLESIREGLSFIRGDPVLRWVIALSIATAP